MVNTPDCGSGMRGFEPHQSPHRGVAKSVRHGTLTPACVGSSPAAPAIIDPLAQSVEHLTFNQGVPRSSRGWITIRPVGQAVKTPPFHGGIRGSIPLRVTKIMQTGD